MITKAPPEVLSPSDLAYMYTLNERDRRWFLATKAADLKAQGFSYRNVSKIMGTSTHSLQNGRQELLSGEGPDDGRIRRAGAGRKSVLPQDENVLWISLSVNQIMSELSAIGYDISRYFVRQILDSLGLRERSFYKDLANKLGIRLLVVHYPPYCSKFNPIEHRLFSQITCSWSGAPLMSLQNAADRAAMTTTKKGLKVHVHINSKTYGIKRPIEESYQKRLARQILFAPELGKWNYLVKPAN